MDRTQKALAYVNLDGRGLEIGPSYSPLVPKSSGARIETVDHAGRAELIEKYRGYGVPSDKIAMIEDVDHVWTHGTLVELVGTYRHFDYIVASHVIEHTVDLIGFLQDCEALLVEGGRLALVIPDKRYCFDFFQPLTSIGAVVDGHLSTAHVHPPGSVLDHFAYGSQRGQGVIAWSSATATPLGLQFADLSSCREIFDKAQRQREYIDIHRWRFTPTSFRLLLSDLRKLEYHRLAEVGGFDTDGFEFFITLARSHDPMPSDDRLTMLLRIEEELRSVVELVGEMLPDPSAEPQQIPFGESERREQQAAAEVERLSAALSASEETLSGVLNSKSWRVTRPLRALNRFLRPSLRR